MIISDICTINAVLAIALSLASVINYTRKWCHNLEHYLLTPLVWSFMIVIFFMTNTLAYFPEMKINDGKMFDGPRVTRLGKFLIFGYFLLGYF